MVARLQAATASPSPILLRTSATTGHGTDAPLDEQITGFADAFAFVFDQLGVSYPPGVIPRS
jgi:prolyl oligopeptidase